MPRAIMDYLNSTILPLSGEKKFQEAATAAGFGVQRTPDGGRMITKKMPASQTPFEIAYKKRSKTVPSPLVGAARD